MKYRKVTAIISDSSLEKVEEALVSIGVSGVTVSTAHGYGEYKNYYAKDKMTDCSRVEIYTEAEKAKLIANTIAGAAQQGLKTDGVIAILPVEEFMHIHEYAGKNITD